MAKTRKTTPKAKPTPKPDAIRFAAGGDPDTDPDAAARVHRDALTGAVYGTAIHGIIRAVLPTENLQQSAMLHARHTLERMKPRDPMEEMLIAQALMAHSRVMHLTRLANMQERYEGIRTIHEYADKASNTYRRLMLALVEYRRPPKAGDSFTAIRQANIAGQQVVMNGEPTEKSATNEQGSSDANTAHDADRQAPQALPADAGGPGIPPSLRSPREAVGAVHRAEDG